MELFLIFAKCTQPYNSISKAALVQSSVITVTKQNFCFVTLKSEGAGNMPMKYSKIMLHKVQAVGSWITWFTSSWEQSNCCQTWAHPQNDNNLNSKWSKIVILGENSCHFSVQLAVNHENQTNCLNRCRPSKSDVHKICCCTHPSKSISPQMCFLKFWRIFSHFLNKNSSKIEWLQRDMT